MIAVLQRVREASVSVRQQIAGQIQGGLVVLLGIEPTDQTEDIQWLTRKISLIRIFNDETGAMNKSIQDTQGDLLLISQFTLMANVKKGNRPSYIHAAKPTVALPLYQQFIKAMEAALCKPIQTGAFGADMQVSLINDGPVTLILNSKERSSMS